MTEHDIDLASLKFHGRTLSEMRNGTLCMTVTHAFHHCKPDTIRCVHYAEMPGIYRLPLRIDITAQVDAPSLYIVFGESYVNDCHIPANDLVDITLIYDLKKMQILKNGEERYYSEREKYMKSPEFKKMNAEGFPLRISCNKRTNIEIHSIRVTEYDGTAGIVNIRDPGEYRSTPPTEKPTFESCISGLPDALRNAVVDMDGWLRTIRPLKFKRQIDKNGTKISYVASEQGFSYAIHISDDVLYHTLQWYILTQGKETWGKRKSNRMEETLNYLAQSDPDFARRLFNNFYECVGGYGPGCMAKSPYTFENKKIISCHGKMYFNMNLSEFDDAKRFIGAVNELTGKGEQTHDE